MRVQLLVELPPLSTPRTARQGQTNLVCKFEEHTGRSYVTKQMKEPETRLCQMEGIEDACDRPCPEAGSISADSWWEEAIAGKFELYKFKNRPLPHEDLMELIIGNATSTSEYTFVLGVDTLDSDGDDDLPVSPL